MFSNAVRGLAVSTLFGFLALLVNGAALAGDRSETFIHKHDKDADGRLSREEYPKWASRLFDLVDKDRDGFVTLEEDRLFRKAREGRGKGRQPRPKNSPRRITKTWPTATMIATFSTSGSRRERGRAPWWSTFTAVVFGGATRTLNPVLHGELLELGITVAAVNYRLTKTAPFPAQMHDCARALQFLRHNAEKYAIDPAKVGATGGSAGAGISQWLAFHRDLADPDAEDPVARESTRISCAVVYGAQTTYDPRRLKEIFETQFVDGALIPFFGMKGPEDVDDPKFHPLFEEASPMHHLTRDDAPVFYYYPQPNKPLPPNPQGKLYIHHPRFGEIIKEKMTALGIECVVKFRKDYPGMEGRTGPVKDYVKFFCRHLLGFGKDR